jgi:hypothetical protein
MINPLQVSFPRERRERKSGLCGGFSFVRGGHGPADEAIMAVGRPSTSAILMFYRADFPSEPAVCPGFRLEGPFMRERRALAEIRTLETPRTSLRFSRRRTAASDLPT